MPCIASYSNSKQDKLLYLIKKYEPLLKKYARKLNYDGAETDLTIAFIEIIRKMPKLGEEKFIISYIQKSIKNKYIKLSIKQQSIIQKEIIYDFNILGKDSIHDINLSIDIRSALKYLTIQQRKIVLLNILQYSDTEIANILNITRQAVNKTKRKAFYTLKIKLLNYSK